MPDHESKLNCKTPDAADEAQGGESALAETPAEAIPPASAKQPALQNPLHELSQELRTAANTFREALQPLLSNLQKAGELIADLNAPNNPAASTKNNTTAQSPGVAAVPTATADAAPAESLADASQPPPAEANANAGNTSAELARQLVAARQGDEADQAALLKAFQEFHIASAANTQKLIEQVRSAAAQQQQLQGQIDALKSALQQQAGQNANRNLNTGS